MAAVVLYKSAGERPLARSRAVQEYLREITFEMEAKAKADLVKNHTAKGHAYIEAKHGDIDWYIVLNDDRGQEAAMSIEFGRAGYIDPNTGELWGAMEGTFILRRATGIPGRRRKVKRKKRIRPRRGANGKFYKAGD